MTFLAVGLWALLSTTSARTAVTAAHEASGTSDVKSCLLTGHSQAPSDSSRQWLAQHHPIAAVTQSAWKSALASAAVAATFSARTVDTTRASGSLYSGARSALPYLRHTPLLI
jgi:hypothetical protein